MVKHDTLTEEQLQNALDVIWEHLECDRDDPGTWIDSGPRNPPVGDHPAILATLYESPIFDMAVEIVGNGHLLSAGGDILQFAETFADRIGLVHLRDQQGDQPVPFGEGDLPFEGLIRTLRGAGYDGTLVVELEGVTWADPAEAARTEREYVETILAA